MYFKPLQQESLSDIKVIWSKITLCWEMKMYFLVNKTIQCNLRKMNLLLFQLLSKCLSLAQLSVLLNKWWYLYHMMSFNSSLNLAQVRESYRLGNTGLFGIMTMCQECTKRHHIMCPVQQHQCNCQLINSVLFMSYKITTPQGALYCKVKHLWW